MLAKLGLSKKFLIDWAERIAFVAAYVVISQVIVALGDLDQAHRVGRVGRADDNHEVSIRCDLLDGDLTILGGVANVVTGWVLQRRELLAQQANSFHGFVHAQRGLR